MQSHLRFRKHLPTLGLHLVCCICHLASCLCTFEAASLHQVFKSHPVFFSKWQKSYSTKIKDKLTNSFGFADSLEYIELYSLFDDDCLDFLHILGPKCFNVVHRLHFCKCLSVFLPIKDPYHINRFCNKIDSHDINLSQLKTTWKML